MDTYPADCSSTDGENPSTISAIPAKKKPRMNQDVPLRPFWPASHAQREPQKQPQMTTGNKQQYHCFDTASSSTSQIARLRVSGMPPLGFHVVVVAVRSR